MVDEEEHQQQAELLVSEDTYVIYGLRRSGSNEYRYVGQTISTALLRLSSHRTSARPERSTLGVHCWMRKHGPENIVADVLESCPTGDLKYLNYSEKYWIQSLKDFGHSLLNHTSGGDGVPGLPAWNKGIPMSDGQKELLRAANTGKTLTIDHKNAIQSGVKTHFSNNPQKSVYAYWVSTYGVEEADARWDELREKRSIQMSGEGNNMFGRSGQDAPCYGRVGDKHPMFGKTHTPEARARQRAASLGRKDSPTTNLRRRFSQHTVHHTNKDKFKDTCIWCLGADLQVEIKRVEISNSDNLESGL